MASQVIFARYSASTPGKMSAVRESLVKNETICKFTRSYGLDRRLRIGTGTDQPRDWVKIHGDVFEAYVCAVVLSDPDPNKGYDTAKKWLTALWEPMLAGLGMTMKRDVKSKEELGRTVLCAGIRLNYVDEKEAVHDRAKGLQTYFIGVYLSGWGYDNQHLGSGRGESKNVAGQEAAKNALENPLLGDIKAKRAAFLEQREMEQAREVKVDNAAA